MSIVFRIFGRGGLLHPTLNISKYRSSIPEETKDKIVLNIGAGGHRLAPHIINLDLFKGDEVDIMGDAHCLPFRNESMDYVLLLAVLEHVQDPAKVECESYRVLKKGGVVYVEFPFLQPEHNAPADYWRVTLHGLRHLFKDFEEIDAGICGGPGSAVSWVLVEYSKVIFKGQYLSKIMSLLTRVLVSPLKYIDRSIVKRGGGEVLSSAFYFYGRKL